MNKFVLFSILVAIIFSCGSKKNSDNKIETIPIQNKPLEDSITDSHTFWVAEVVMADTLLNLSPAKDVFEIKLKKEILFFPENQKNEKYLYKANNILIETLEECYDNHRPLILTPDVIWLAICQGVSIHINEKFDSLKNTIFLKNKPETLKIRNDSLEYNAKAWKELIASLSEEAVKYTQPNFYDFFVPKFSTTSEIITTTYQITLLESLKKAYVYVGDSGCGIPYITVKGTKSDWEEILIKIEMLDKLGLTQWKKSLIPIIKEFIAVFDNQINIEFWNDIYKNATAYNEFYISGWIIKFFPYIKHIEDSGEIIDSLGVEKIEEKYHPNKFMNGNSYLLSTLSTDNFPSGISKIDVIWNNFFKDDTKNMEVYAGFMAIKQHNDKRLEPVISWAICEQDANSTEHKLSDNNWKPIPHKQDYWAPLIVERITDSAIYNSKEFKNQYKSLEYLKESILDSVEQNQNFRKAKLKGIEIEFIVLINGGISNIKISSPVENQKLEKYVYSIVKNTEGYWFPALAHPLDVMDFIDLTEEDEQLKVKVNSVVKFKL